MTNYSNETITVQVHRETLRRAIDFLNRFADEDPTATPGRKHWSGEDCREHERRHQARDAARALAGAEATTCEVIAELTRFANDLDIDRADGVVSFHVSVQPCATVDASSHGSFGADAQTREAAERYRKAYRYAGVHNARGQRVHWADGERVRVKSSIWCG